MRPVEVVLAKLRGVKREGSNWKAHCPAHEDPVPSLSIAEGDDGRALLYCHAGCTLQDILSALGLRTSDLFERHGDVRGGVANPSENGETARHFRLADYARLKALPIEHLRDQGLTEFKRNGEWVVRIPYLEAGGETVATRFRTSPSGRNCHLWKSGDKPQLYGQKRLDEAREAGYVAVVEGESDCLTLWHHGFPAVGIPGVNTYKPRWAQEHLQNIPKVYAIVEDEAGEILWNELAATPGLAERLYRVELQGAKDPSELYLKDPEGFEAAFREALRRAVPCSDIAEGEVKERSERAWQVCKPLARDKNILARLEEDLRKVPLVGEEKNAEIVYLCLISRFLDRPVNPLVKGPSAAGKSYLVEAVLKFVPVDAYITFTGMSEKAIVYDDRPIKHRFLVIFEAAGMGSELQQYLVRSLLSEGRVRYTTVMKTSESLVPVTIEREGPTGLILTTTRVSIHAENETRHLSLQTKDTTEQTAMIMAATAEDAPQGPDFARWHTLGEWLELQNHEVSVPYASVLSQLIPPVAVRLRRDFKAILSLIRAHAILHQANRNTDERDRIVAEVADYAAVRDLVSDLVSEGVESTVPKDVRETVEAVERLTEDKPEGIPSGALVEALNIDKWAVSRRTKKATELEYIKNLEDRKGAKAKWVLDEPMPDDAPILPEPSRLGSCPAVSPPSEGKDLPPSYQGATARGGVSGSTGDSSREEELVR